MKCSYLQPCRVISADWSNNIWNVTEAFLFIYFCAALVFLLWWVNTRSKWSLSSDITCQSRQEKCSLKVTLLWCLYSACHYIFHFLWAKIYNLSFDRRSKHLYMTRAVIFPDKQRKTCLSPYDPWQSRRKQQTKHFLFFYTLNIKHESKALEETALNFQGIKESNWVRNGIINSLQDLWCWQWLYFCILCGITRRWEPWNEQRLHN